MVKYHCLLPVNYFCVMPLVSFFNADVTDKIKNKRHIKKYIPIIFAHEGKLLQSLIVIFCSDKYLLSLNKQFLNHDYYTDILTFDLSSDENINGEIYISVNRVLENSSLHDTSFQEETLRVVFHGVLHLCGYRDKTAFEKQKMTAKENEFLLGYFSSFT